MRRRRICFAGTCRFRSSGGGVPRVEVAASAPMLRMVPDVPMTRSNPAVTICSDLDAATADVDDDGTAAADVHAIHRRLMDEARFFDARDHAGPDAGVTLDAREEFTAVARLAGGARRGGENLVYPMRFRDSLELRQRLQRGGHCLGGQRAAIQPARPKPDHGLLAVDHLERQVGPDAHHDHVDRVGADVDGREAHI